MPQFNLQALLEAEVIDKLLAVMKVEDERLRTQMAGLGTRVGQATTWAGLPTVDQNGKAVTAGDTAMLTQTDGEHPAGLYAYDGNAWNAQPDLNYDDLDVASIIDNAKATQAEFDAGSDSKLTTPSQVLAAIAAATAADKVISDEAYHPKGGDATMKILAQEGDENTDEVVTAKQLSATFTIAEVQAKYDAL